ncbi:hypothetical protein MDAP_002717 [Mitosporidium daphniae]|uniref:Uncharacterized protein n=1 Tax=Mitosporidium daphniae TaxID=1485682 RepID=A0A098VSY7_9MICR|nr:uncharacterized protein DI09_1p630 [Mitosporidium daphniae]KGG52213.1 hypothetical protein DI09_1p630 [Mitosporidium daphniae]|eukprot:XP_013238640.1 uncharacterized protein DI09_1p630 [Mitosporidium daphniae]
MTSLLTQPANPLAKSEVTYISPPPPPILSAPKKTITNPLQDQKKAKYAQLLNQREEDHFLLQQNDLEREKSAWNNVLTWLLALLALTLLPFALHYGIKSTHPPNVVVPSGMQTHSIKHQPRHENGISGTAAAPMASSPSSSTVVAPHICVCTVRRINKLTNDVRTSTLKFPISHLAAHSTWDEECERLCAEERPKMVETLNVDEWHGNGHNTKPSEPMHVSKSPKLPDENPKELERAIGGLFDALLSVAPIEDTHSPLIDDAAIFDMLLSSLSAPEAAGSTFVKKPMRVSPVSSHISEDLFGPLIKKEPPTSPVDADKDIRIPLFKDGDLFHPSSSPMMLSAMLLGMGASNETAHTPLILS